jgi:hypothetical protein
MSVAVRDPDHLTVGEIVFLIFGFAFVLDEYAVALQNGWNSKC